MTRATLGQRLGRLEQAVGDTLPLCLRRWLGESLSHDDHVTADAEWERLARGPGEQSKISDDAQSWLSRRDLPAGGRNTFGINRGTKTPEDHQATGNPRRTTP